MGLKILPFLLLITLNTFHAYSQTSEKPNSNRFTKVVLAQQVEEPMQFHVLKDGKVLLAERKGKLKVYDPVSQSTTVIANLDVSTKYISKTGEKSEGEDGLQGVILDPDYDQNHWIYIYYSPAGDEAKNSLVRYTWLGGELIESSKKVILNVPVQREECCHVGGGMVFDKDKNLYLSTGDNTFSRASDGFSPLDERPDASTHDSQKSSSNTNDLRGKILRIHPEADGTYSIPDGNLFPIGTPRTRPEIYTMGNRNPWRLSIDQNGWLYWGEVGPDGSQDDFEKRGPQSYDEFNLAKKAGNYGWPYFSADNKAYRKYDFTTKESGALFNPLKPVNNSPHSSGLNQLPIAIPALMWYGKGNSEEFPLFESGSNSAVGGPIYNRSSFNNPQRPFPDYYEGKWFITDWVRGWINVVELDENGAYKSMERFLPDLKLKGPIDMKFGPEGDLYVLEYGNGYFKDNPEAALIKIEYNAGNRKPQVRAEASKTAGAVPLNVKLSSDGTIDFDEGDVLTYEWIVTKAGIPSKVFKEPNPVVSFTTPGVYEAVLTVTDSQGGKNSKTIEINAGNEPPVVKFEITSGNSKFFLPGKAIRYSVSVNDKEDGSIDDKGVMPSSVSVRADYLSEGYNLTEVAQKQMKVVSSTQHSNAITLFNNSTCKSCHSMNEKTLGPGLMQIAEKYKGDGSAPDKLLKKVKSGGSGVWGDAMMPAHPSMADGDVNAIVKYILNLAFPAEDIESLPVKGDYTAVIPENVNKDASLIFYASYTDKGAETVPAQTSEDIFILYAPFISVSVASESKGISFSSNKETATISESGGYLKFDNIDLTNVNHVEVITENKERSKNTGTIEIYSNALQGTLLGKFSGNYENSIRIDLSNTLGTANLYFVFSGPSLPVREIKFK